MKNICILLKLLNWWIIAQPDRENTTVQAFYTNSLEFSSQAAIREQQHVLRGVQQRKGA